MCPFLLCLCCQSCDSTNGSVYSVTVAERGDDISWEWSKHLVVSVLYTECGKRHSHLSAVRAEGKT